MEGAPVTAATGALGPVVAKLGALLGSEYKLRQQTRKDIKFIKPKLKSMHSILWIIWEREDLDAESKDLKKEALDLADDMVDAIDDFILSMERSSSTDNKHMLIQSKIKAASPFQDFKTRVNDVSARCRSKWKLKNISSPAIKPPPRAPFVRKDASDLLRMSGWKVDLIHYLVGEEPQLKMASIVGMAGVGKTTLARLVYEEIENVYEEIENIFQSRAFVSVTPSPNIKEVLTSILQQVGAEPLAGSKASTEEHIIHSISNFLEDKRYLVIIDDIWHRGEWEIIRKSFPGNNQGSRIVMTTRIDSVPGDDDLDNNKIYIRMNPEYSFANRRWLYGDGQGSLRAWMKKHAYMVGEGFDCDHRIVRMCGGVPLALLCMFSAMTKFREQQEQQGVHLKACDLQDMVEKQVKRSGIQNTPGFEPLVESLQLGYDDLPHHMLKTCLLYCSIYPENYHFRGDDFVMRWVAEGFVCEEDAAKGYFDELVNKGLILQMEGPFGSYIPLMNPMMRNFLRWKSREDNFIAWSSDMTSAYACRIHRLCIDNYPDDGGAVVDGVDLLSRLDWSQIRSLVVFEGAKRLPLEKLERMRVLDLQLEKESTTIGNEHVKDICGLLGVRHIFVLTRSKISEIPPEIARLRYLETLQVRGTSITELPSEIGKLQQLKTLDVSDNRELTELRREIGNLQQLKTLDVSGNRQITELHREIGDLQHLETLRMFGTRITCLPGETIRRLRKLKTLDVGDCWRLKKLPRKIGELQNLETLDLTGCQGITKLPREIGKLYNLKRLSVVGTSVRWIPREIGRLKKLKASGLRYNVGILPWEVCLLSEIMEGVPKCVSQALKNKDLVSELAGEIMSVQINKSDNDRGGLVVSTKHMCIPRWIKDHFNNLGSLDIRICKLEEQDLKILREMPSLGILVLRFQVVPRNPISISGEGFPRLEVLEVDSRVPRITFQAGAMRRLETLRFSFQSHGGPPNEEPMGIKHLLALHCVVFKCNNWYRADNPCISATIRVARREALEHPKLVLVNIIDMWV
uniref:Uncharacterized protein n=2 Tax=Avena sativa TaxID=4498 RepID=A0ACD5ZS39_AVESA